MLINEIKNNYKDVPDLKLRKIKYKLSNIYIFYVETICSSEQINNFILKNITNPVKKRNINNILATPNLVKINKDEIDKYLFNVFSSLVYILFPSISVFGKPYTISQVIPNSLKEVSSLF